ncbi:MAG: DUF2867 domain-containing protein [Desulfobacterales bacterium]|nr:DUF2867 domain-containing protein [Desulfobacterales bacterium]MCP4159346.1 DUF2867 domain-containing protein [Deltaproteobacteria bacterium]
MKVFKINKLPESSLITRDIKGDVDYIDSYMVRVEIPDDISIDYLTAIAFTFNPGWVDSLLKIRDICVKPFCLKAGHPPSEKTTFDKKVYFKKGEKAVMFTVSDRSENEIVMSENDKHLYFRTSILMEKDRDGFYKIYSNTLVQFHNKLGKAYFIPVKPFHKLIIRVMLKNLAKKLLKKL